MRNKNTLIKIRGKCWVLCAGTYRISDANLEYLISLPDQLWAGFLHGTYRFDTLRSNDEPELLVDLNDIAHTRAQVETLIEKWTPTSQSTATPISSEALWDWAVKKGTQPPEAVLAGVLESWAASEYADLAREDLIDDAISAACYGTKGYYNMTKDELLQELYDEIWGPDGGYEIETIEEFEKEFLDDEDDDTEEEDDDDE